MMQTNGYLPFTWPKKTPRNDDFPVFTVADEQELTLVMKQKFPDQTPMLVGTHNSVFHCDEVMATVLLKYAGLLKKPGAIVRTRNEELLKKLKIVYDVGGIINPKELRYDHHMRDFKGKDLWHTWDRDF